MPVKRRGRQDLRLQLLALYLLFVVPIIIVGIIFYYNAGQRLRADVTAADLSLARAIALETDDILLKAKDAVADFAQMPEVVERDIAGMDKIFSAGAAARQDINLFYRLSKNGIMLYHYPPAPGSTVGNNFSFRDYFQASRQTGMHVFSKGRVSPTTGRPVVSSVMPIFRQGRFDGVVATNIELQRLTETLRRIDPDRPPGSGEKIIIVDAAGQVIAHSKADTLLENILEELPGVEEVLAGQEGWLTAKDKFEVEWLNSFTPIPSAGWGVIVQRPTELAFASLDSFQRGLALALGIYGLGAIFFWVVLSRRVINPLVKLTHYGESVGNDRQQSQSGRTDILPISHRRDQIGRLALTLLRAEENIRRRFLELTTLNRTSTAVVSTLNTQKVIDSILDEVQQLLSVRQCALLVLDESTRQLKMQASRELGEVASINVNLPAANRLSPVFQAIETNQPVQVHDNGEKNNWPLLFAARTEDCRSALIIPITAPHISPAVLIIFQANIHQFSRQEIDLATSFANHAAIALEHAMLFGLTDAELQKQVRSLSALNRVGRTVSQSLLLENVLNNAMGAVFEIMPADACWIYLQRENESFLRLRAQRGLPPNVLDRIRDQPIEHQQGAVGQVVANNQPILLDKLRLTPEIWPNDPIIAVGNLQSLAATPLSAKDAVIGVLGMSTHTDRAFSDAEIDLLQAIGDQIAIAVVNARLFRRSREMATLEERNRMAREIHDTLAQGFTGILVQLQAAERLSLKRPKQALQSLQEARELARESLQEARRSVLNLRPTVLENLTLDEAIAQQVKRFESATGIKSTFAVEGYPGYHHPRVEENLYRITQEALTNVNRHAQAGLVWVTLAFDGNTVSLTIADNGQGLGIKVKNKTDLEKLSGDNGHFGLLGIQERVSLMGGKVDFESPARGGTQIKVTIPGEQDD